MFGMTGGGLINDNEPGLQLLLSLGLYQNLNQ